MSDGAESADPLDTAPDVVPLPPEVAEELIGYGLQTAPGKALWRGFLLGKGLPKGDGAIDVWEAVYRPAARVVEPAGPPGPA